MGRRYSLGSEKESWARDLCSSWGPKPEEGIGRSIQGQEEERWAQDRALRGEQRRVQKEEEEGSDR